MDNIDLVDYSRQADMDVILNRALNFKNVVIVGCGGVGYWAALLLAMMGKENFILIDGDKIEQSNLNRLPVPQTWVGINKAIALRKLIRTIRPATRISCVTRHVVNDDMDMFNTMIQMPREYDYRTMTLVVDTTDDARIQQKIYEVINTHSGNRSIRYIKMGYEGFKVGAYKNMATWIPDDYRPGYRTTQANAVSSVGAAVVGILSAYFAHTDITCNLADIAGKMD